MSTTFEQREAMGEASLVCKLCGYTFIDAPETIDYIHCHYCDNQCDKWPESYWCTGFDQDGNQL